jgi:hypothetical protein
MLEYHDDHVRADRWRRTAFLRRIADHTQGRTLAVLAVPIELPDRALADVTTAARACVSSAELVALWWDRRRLPTWGIDARGDARRPGPTVTELCDRLGGLTRDPTRYLEDRLLLALDRKGIAALEDAPVDALLSRPLAARFRYLLDVRIAREEGAD